jgi:hypothetical protein
MAVRLAVIGGKIAPKSTPWQAFSSGSFINAKASYHIILEVLEVKTSKANTM